MVDSVILDRPVVLFACLVFVGVALIWLLSTSKLLNLPIVAAKSGEWFLLLRARWRNALDPKAASEIAYNSYHESACILPMAGTQNFV